MLATSVSRVPENTSEERNENIRRQTEANVACYVGASPAEIEQRLGELNREWDIERAIEANAATAVLVGAGLGTFVNRGFWALPVAVAGFLLQHAIQGWCPPVPLFRRLGFRTPHEIEQERYALKTLRGDFDGVSGSPHQSDGVMQAVRR